MEKKCCVQNKQHIFVCYRIFFLIQQLSKNLCHKSQIHLDHLECSVSWQY